MDATGKVLLIAEDHERVAIKSFRNLGRVIASSLGQANTYDVLWADTIVMSQGTLDLGQSAPRGTEEHAATAEAAKEAGPEGAPKDTAATPEPETDNGDDAAASPDNGIVDDSPEAPNPSEEADDVLPEVGSATDETQIDATTDPGAASDDEDTEDPEDSSQ